MLRHTIFALGLIAAAPAIAQENAKENAQGDVSVTIYNSGISLVQDIRQIGLPKGRTKQEFPDVSAQIQPQTVTLVGDSIGIVEQNFDFDLLTPAKLLEKSVGKTVTLIRTHPTTGAETRETAKVLAVNGGTVLQIGQRIETYESYNLGRIVFDKVPDNLRARPTLSVTMESGKSGSRPLSLSYLTGGMGWNADYVALFDERAKKIDVQGWVTLTNNTGTTFNRARTLLVAGSPNGGGGNNWQQQQNMRRAGTQTANRERLGDFYIYPIKERTTIANSQTKQVSFLDVGGAPAQKAYEYRLGWLQTIGEPQSFATVLKFSTSSEAGLGDALPAGTVRVYMKDSRGQPQFIGENTIGHTPMGSDLAIKTGEAFDVKIKTTVEKREKVTESEWREAARWTVNYSDGRWSKGTAEEKVYTNYYQTTVRYTITNARPEAITADVTQDGIYWWWYDMTRVVKETHKGKRTSESSIQWSVPVPANGSTDLVVTYQTRW